MLILILESVGSAILNLVFLFLNAFLIFITVAFTGTLNTAVKDKTKLDQMKMQDELVDTKEYCYK